MTFSHFLPSAREIAEQIRSKEVSPVEVARAHLDRIARLNPKLNAFVDYQPEAVLAQARAAEKAILRRNKDKDELAPLHGVPLSIKSSIDVAGHRCEAGTRLRAGYVASEDAPLVARLRAAGAVILGVTNTPELLMAWETDNLLYGRTNNPWDVNRTAGGSSGGEAAAIAAGLSAGRRGQRRRRFDPRAGALLRHLRIEAHSRTHSFDRALSEIWRAFCPDRSGRADGSHRRRFENAV